MQEEDGNRAMRPVLAGLIAAILIGGSVDLVLDRPTSWTSAHTIYELLLIAGAVTASVWLWINWKHATESVAALRLSLVERQAERDAWRLRAAQALDGLSRAVHDQFAAWGLTPSEQEVALRLLKGESHKAIAGATGRSERTVRQHAVAAYGKAGLGGRAELAAFFLGDLRLPS
jgi:DNA-binding CsgD family transcriptional regulator